MYQNLFAGRRPEAILQNLSEGILGCAANAARLLADVELLVGSGRYASATFLVTTAKEEMAKAYILLDACRVNLSRHENILRRLSRAFYDHIAKHAYYSIHRLPSIASMEALKQMWEAETTRLWVSGDPESGEPDMPHATYFDRELPLYVSFSDYVGAWLVPDDKSHEFQFERLLGLDFMKNTNMMLDRLRHAEQQGLFNPEVLDILNASLRGHYFSESTSLQEITTYYHRFAAQVSRSINVDVDGILRSPLAAVPLYHCA